MFCVKHFASCGIYDLFLPAKKVPGTGKAPGTGWFQGLCLFSMLQLTPGLKRLDHVFRDSVHLVKIHGGQIKGFQFVVVCLGLF